MHAPIPRRTPASAPVHSQGPLVPLQGVRDLIPLEEQKRLQSIRAYVVLATILPGCAPRPAASASIAFPFANSRCALETHGICSLSSLRLCCHSRSALSISFSAFVRSSTRLIWSLSPLAMLT